MAAVGPYPDRFIAWMRLARIPNIGPVLVRRVVQALGSPEAVLGAHPNRLAAVEGIGPMRAESFSRAPSAAEVEQDRAKAAGAGIRIICSDDEEWPAGLRTIGDPPIVLYVKGRLVPADAVSLGIVGARNCTLYGREQSERFGAILGEAGLCVVSGGARGIDTGAHEGALRAKGRTVVVQGCGLLNSYPPENKPLYDRIVATDAGAIISELPLDAAPLAENFPPRNRIIAGMSLGVLVIEANMRSGSLITARLAADDYGREVFALPGRVDSPASSGTHHLIKTGGARLVEGLQDILDGLGDVGAVLQKVEARQKSPPPPQARAPSPQATAELLFAPEAEREEPKIIWTGVQKKVLAAMDSKAVSVDELCEKTELPAAVLMAELTMLQIRGAVERAGGNRFAKKA